MFKLTHWVLLAILSYHLICPKQSIASESAIAVSPAILEMVIDSTTTQINQVTLINTTSFPLPVKSQVSSFITEKSTVKSPNTYDASSWFSVEPKDFILQPHEQKVITLTITAPPGSEPGGHYATVYFEPLVPASVLSHRSTISLARVGVLALMIVKGDINESLELQDISTSKWQTFGPITTDLTFLNSGNVHLLPQGQLEIKDLFGNTQISLPIEPSLVLPNLTNNFQLTWDKQLLFGRYQIILHYKYGAESNYQSSDPIYIWILPWPIILIVSVLLTLFYKLFIVHIDRVKLAIKVLRNKNV